MKRIVCLCTTAILLVFASCSSQKETAEHKYVSVVGGDLGVMISYRGAGFCAESITICAFVEGFRHSKTKVRKEALQTAREGLSSTMESTKQAVMGNNASRYERGTEEECESKYHGVSRTINVRESGLRKNDLEVNENKINGHEYVDLGLPNGLKWATCNVGANSPSDYGNYYAWGETTTKTDYTEENSKTYNKKIGEIRGNASYDAARANWGATWRMPTKEEFEELLNNCTWTWTTRGGEKGYQVTGPNGNSIFLPAAGIRSGTSFINVGFYGGYWSSTSYEDNTWCAYGLNFISDYRSTYYNFRDGGRSVRPVSE